MLLWEKKKLDKKIIAGVCEVAVGARRKKEKVRSRCWCRAFEGKKRGLSSYFVVKALKKLNSYNIQKVTL